MRNLLILWLSLLGCVTAQDNFDVTFRTRYVRSDDQKGLIEGHGTAFAVDLSAWGLEGNHYLITAAHNTYDDQSKTERTKLELELKKDRWVAFDVIWIDLELDIAVIRCAKELPRLTQIAADDIRPKERVTMLGSPQGIPIKSYAGVVLRRFAEGFKTKVLIEFDHGDSGAPLFNQDNQVVGMAVSGFFKDKSYELDPRFGGFVPTSVLRSFLDEHK